jgi:hypothetical protein
LENPIVGVKDADDQNICVWTNIPDFRNGPDFVNCFDFKKMADLEKRAVFVLNREFENASERVNFMEDENVRVAVNLIEVRKRIL